MTQRKYSIDEIDSMRESVAVIEACIKGSHRRSERDGLVEDKLRTYMLNGTSPDELKDHAASTHDEHFERINDEYIERIRIIRS